MTIRALPLLLVFAVAFCGSSATADIPCELAPWAASEQSLEQFDFDSALDTAALVGKARVRKIDVIRQNVFPGSNHQLASVANRFNTLTRESAIRAALLIEAGQEVGAAELAEAERALRRKSFLYDARVLVRQRCENDLDVVVVVRDVWTLVPNISFARSGGDNKTILGISDGNVLGSGKEISIVYLNDRDRSGYNLRFDDPNIAGSRWRGSIALADNDDGHGVNASLERPFFALDTRFAAGFRLQSFERDQDLEFLSEDAYTLDGEGERAEAYLGRSSGRTGNYVDRLWVGLAYEREAYQFPMGFPGPLETERTFAYPFLAWQRQQDRFVVRENVERIERTEDLDLGLYARARAGISTNALGGDGDVLLFNLGLGGRWYLTDSQLLSTSISWHGRVDLDAWDTQDSVASIQSEYLWKHSARMSFLLRAQATATRDLDLDQQLTQGGDTGLRGYPSRFQVGDRRFLFTIEERYYTDWLPLGLFRVGFAAFADVGRAWFEDRPPAWVPARDQDYFDTLSNVGLGLRFESIRTRRDRVLHIDFARPLVDGPDVDSLSITISAKQAL